MNVEKLVDVLHQGAIDALAPNGTEREIKGARKILRRIFNAVLVEEGETTDCEWIEVYNLVHKIVEEMNRRGARPKNRKDDEVDLGGEG